MSLSIEAKKALIRGCKDKLKTFIESASSNVERERFLDFPNVEFKPISSELSAKYPGYESALDILAKHREDYASKIKQTESLVKSVKDKSERNKYANKLRELQIEQLKYEPEVRFRVREKDYDMKTPVYQHFAQKAFEDYNKLRIMQRFETMNVIPDLIAEFDPILDVRLFQQPSSEETSPEKISSEETSSEETSPEETSPEETSPGETSPGEIVPITWAYRLPRLSVIPFDSQDRKLTILICDPDTPDFENLSYKTKILYGASNIKHNVQNPTIDFNNASVWSEYTPPEIFEGLGKHRIVILVCDQNGEKVNTSEFTPNEGKEFDSHQFLKDTGMSVIGGSLYRIQWDRYSASYLEMAGIPYPKFALERIQPSESKKAIREVLKK